MVSSCPPEKLALGIEVSFESRIALVTGALSGLGNRFAKVLAEAGAQVVLASRRTERLKALRAEAEFITADKGIHVMQGVHRWIFRLRLNRHIELFLYFASNTERLSLPAFFAFLASATKACQVADNFIKSLK